MAALPIDSLFDPSITSDPYGHTGLSEAEEQPAGTVDHTMEATAADDGGMGDLFGDEDGDEAEQPQERLSSPTPSLPGSDPDGLTATERRKRKAMEYEEDDGAEGDAVQLQEQIMHVPNLPLPKPSDGNHWIVRMPNYIKVEPLPFDRDSYQGSTIDAELTQGANAREKSMAIKMEVENTIRWRWVESADGSMRKQSNSRIIRWSDGSMSLQLGKELFDISANIDLPSNTAVPPRTNSSTATGSQSAHGLSRNQGLLYLYAQHQNSRILQGEAAVAGTLSLTPTGMQSETHRRLVRAVGQKHTKTTRLMMAPDPTKESELQRAEQLKAGKKVSRSRRPAGDRDSPKKRRSARKREVYSTDEEETDDGGDYSRPPSKPSGQKKSSRKGDAEGTDDGFVQADDLEEVPEDDVDILDEADARIEREHLLERRKDRSKPSRKRDESEESDAAMDESEEDTEMAVRPAAGRKTRRLAVEESDDEE